LSQAWKGGDSDNESLDGETSRVQRDLMKDMEGLDDQDREMDEAADDHETAYNFRYEDKNSAYLTTHTREVPEDSMRRKDDKRKKERETKKERKEEVKR
jgi:hypothetical protein